MGNARSQPDTPFTGSVAVFAAAVFLGAFLLFQIQPLISKAILPWFGGSPSVWNSCLVFFQAMLFLGYGYAHLSCRLLGRLGQLLVHAGLIVAAAILLSILPSADQAPEGTENPVWLILRLLATNVGLPFFVLAGTGPLLQAWYTRLHPGKIPYRLYALSNTGSLLALLSYPFVIEPLLAMPGQARLWSGLFLIFGLLAVGCAALTWRRAPAATPDSAVESADTTDASAPGGKPWQWLVWSACGVILLMSVTNRLCLDIAAIPFLWILPLSVYLLSYIVAFSGKRFYRRRLMLVIMFLSLPVLIQVGAEHVKLVGLVYLDLSTMTQVTILIVILAVFDLVCHGELYRLRPPAGRLTAFYLYIAAGGSLGGLLVALVAPLIFPFFEELVLGALAVGGFALWSLIREPDSVINRGNVRLRKVAVAAGYLACAVLLIMRTGRLPQETVFVERNYHGAVYVVRLDADHPQQERLVMRHGTTKHGAQYVRPPDRFIPTTYYSPYTGVGLSLIAYQESLGRDEPMHVGVVGLGIGTLAAYARPGDRYRFYEIDPAVARIAATRMLPGDDNLRFTYLGTCRGDVRIVIGDARLKMEQELQSDPGGQKFDYLVLDAFSSDAVPVHLLTREAFAVYERHLQDDGVIAIHISSSNFDLRPVCYQLALENGFQASLIVNKQRGLVDQPGINSDRSLLSTWCILYRDEAFLAKFMEVSRPYLDSGEISGELATPGSIEGFRPWTDQYSNLFGVFER